MDIKEILKTYCVGCSGGYPKVRFVRPEGDRYVHMKGSINPQREQLTVDLVCTATPSFFTRDIEEMSFERYMKQIGKDDGIQLPSELADKTSIVDKSLMPGEQSDGRQVFSSYTPGVSIPSGPQRSKLPFDKDPPPFLI